MGSQKFSKLEYCDFCICTWYQQLKLFSQASAFEVKTCGIQGSSLDNCRTRKFPTCWCQQNFLALAEKQGREVKGMQKKEENTEELVEREVLVYSCYLFIYVYDPHCYWINLFSTGNLQDMLACFLHVFFFQKQISSKFQNLSFQVTHSRDLSKTSSWDAVCSEVILW